jgi:hypothetical protein
VETSEGIGPEVELPENIRLEVEPPEDIGLEEGGIKFRIKTIRVKKLNAGQVAKWPTATDCKSVLFGVRWFESILAHSSLFVLDLSV